MEPKLINALGLKCPQPIIKISAAVLGMKSGELIEVEADCPSFEADVREWCARTNHTVLWFKDEGGKKRCQIKI